jgi:hypothetical protein
MLMNMNRIKRFLVGMLAGLVLLTACEPEEELLGPDRLFRPVIKGELVSEGNWLLATWYPVKSALNYKVELSQDTFKTILASQLVDTSRVLFEDLLWDAPYQVRVQANAPDTEKNSGLALLGYKRTAKFPTILTAASPSKDDVTDGAIRVKWTNSGAPATRLKVFRSADQVLVREISLTETDLTRGYRDVSGLKGNTSYTIYIYSGETNRGWETYTTKEPLVGNIVDLRGILARPSVLLDTLPAVPAGSIILLNKGETYNISSATALDKSLTFMSGSDFDVTTPATLYFTSNFDFAAGSNMEYLSFKDLILRGSDATAKYVFNATNGATVGTLSFESCRAEAFRGLVRLRGNSTISEFLVDNSVLRDIRGYGVLTVDDVNAKVNNIIVRNSSVYNAEKLITSRQSANAVRIENCTINEAPLGGNYLVDFNAMEVSGGITISNSIFGVGKSKSGDILVRGYRAAAGTNVFVSNVYTTSDYALALSAAGTFPGTESYSKPAADVLAIDAVHFYLTIKDAGFPGKASAGDPRGRL